MQKTASPIEQESVTAPSINMLPVVQPVRDIDTEGFDRIYAYLRAKVCDDLLVVLQNEFIKRVLVETNHNHLRSSRILGINRATLKKHAKLLGFEKPKKKQV